MKKLLNHFKRFFPFYLVWTLVSVFAVIWEFSILTKPTEDEKIDFFVCADVVDPEGFELFVNENMPSYLKEVNVNFIEDNNYIFSQNLSTYGDLVTDIYIMNKNKFDLVTGKDYYFTLLDETKSKDLFGNEIEFYKNDKNEAYAIKIENDFFSEESEIYLGFAKNSNHLNGLKDGGFAGAISLAQQIIK